MINFMITQLNNSINEIYEIFGNLITIDDIDTRNILIVNIIVTSKILIQIIDNSQMNNDTTSYEFKSLKIIKERLNDLVDRAIIIIEYKNIKPSIKLIHKLSGSKINPKVWQKVKPDLDFEFINRFVELNTNYNNILHFDDNTRNILLYLRKANINLACAMIDVRLSDKELNSGNCFTQKRDLIFQKELCVRSSNFIDLILKKSSLKNISIEIYKLVKPN